MTRVVKIGGRAQAAAALVPAIARAVQESVTGLVIVHGGGDEVSALQRRLGMEPHFVGGRRVTTDSDLDLVRMVLSGSANKRLVGALRAAAVRAVGLSGEDGGLLRAQVAPGAPLGRVGERIEADVHVLRDLLAHGWVPVVSPVAADADSLHGEALNVNGDDAAAAIAVALGASELLFVADVAGVLDGDSVIPMLDEAGARALVARGIAAGGMAAKLDASTRAVQGGVARVRISDTAALNDADRGTLISPDARVA